MTQFKNHSSNTTQMSFYIVRHAQTDWNHQKKIQGHIDIPLNDTGRAQAAALATELKKVSFGACFTSDLTRAYETAQILNSHHSLKLNTDKRLRERHFGSWEGRLSEEFHRAGPEEKADVEPHVEVQSRSLDFLNEIAKRCQGMNNILIVTHGGVLRNLIIKILKLTCTPEDLTALNTSVIQLAYCEEQWSLKETRGVSGHL